MKVNNEYLIRVLAVGKFAATIEGNYVVLELRTIQGFQIKVAVGGGAVEFWLQSYDANDQPNGAWVEVQIPIPEPLTAYLGGSIRWAANKIIFYPSDKV